VKGGHSSRKLKTSRLSEEKESLDFGKEIEPSAGGDQRKKKRILDGKEM